MKVLMFNKLFHPFIGGVERHVYDLCEGLRDRVSLSVLAANTKPITEIECKEGYRVVRAASLGVILSSVHLSLVMPFWWRRIESDIIHYHFPSPIAEIYCLLLTPKDKPIVVSYHSDIVGHRRALFFYRALLEKFLKRADVIIVGSPHLSEKSPFLAKHRSKCVTVPYGLQLEKFKPTDVIEDKAGMIKERFGGPLILFMGRLVAYKGVEYLIKAMKAVEGKLLIVGKGPEEERLKVIAKEEGIFNGKIFFLGTVSDEDLPSYYYAIELLVLPSVSNNEAFGLVQIEAQACSRPVVSTSLPTGVIFANIDKETGLVVEPRNSEKLAEAIRKLLNDHDLRERLGENGRKRVFAQFNVHNMVDKVLAIYRSLA